MPTPEYAHFDTIQVTETDMRSGREVQGVVPVPQGVEDTSIYNRITSAVEDRRAYRNIGAVGVLLVEPAREQSGLLEVQFGPWGTAANQGELRLLEMAASAGGARDGRTIAFIDYPGAGKSAALGKAMARQLRKTGEFAAYAEHTLKEIDHLLSDYDRIGFRGQSAGGRAAIGAAVIRKAAYLDAYDPPGSHRRSYFSLMRAFAGTEGGHAKRYLQASQDEGAAVAQRAYDSLGSIKRRVAEQRKSGGLRHMIVDQPTAMARGTLAVELAQAYPNVEYWLRVSTPEYSALAHPHEVHRLLTDIVHKQPNASPSLVQHQVIHGHSHAAQQGHPGFFAAVHHGGVIH